jgi:hypothetical protein
MAPRFERWGWTCAAGKGRVRSRGVPRGHASGKAPGETCSLGTSQASHGVNPVKGLLGPVEVLKATPAEYAVGVAFQ